MKNFKMMSGAIIITVFSIFAGCSDQITSSEKTGSSQKDEGVNLQEAEKLPYIESYKFKISLKPGANYLLNHQSTGLDKLYSIDVWKTPEIPEFEKSASDCNGIFVYNNSSLIKLSCHSAGFDLDEVTVENTGNTSVNLEVILKGFKQSNKYLNSDN